MDFVGKFLPTDIDPGNSYWFGEVVAMSGTPGNAVAMVSASGETVEGVSNAGVAYMYENRTGTSWTLVAKLEPPTDAQEDGYFSYWSDLSGTPGNAVAIITESYATVTVYPSAGRIHFYEDRGAGWTYVSTHTAQPEPTENGYYGNAVHISGTPGNAVATVSNYYIEHDAVDVYTNTSGSTWTLSATIEDPDGAYMSSDHKFGWYCDVSGTPGNAVMSVSTPFRDGDVDGIIYVYHNTSGNTWDKVFEIEKTEAGDRLGFGLGGVAGTPGSSILVCRDDTNVYIYENSNSDNYVQVATFEYTAEDTNGWAQLAVSGTIGNAIVAVGCPGDTEAGYVSVYRSQEAGSWTLFTTLTGPDVQPSDNYAGKGIAVTGNARDAFIGTGADYQDDRTGAAYFYSLVTPCFGRNTRITMANGSEKLVRDIRPNDVVRIRSKPTGPTAAAVVRDVVRATASELVCLPASCMSPGVPRVPLYLTPKHLIMLENGSSVQAREIPGATRIVVKAGAPVYHIKTDSWAFVLADQLLCETMAWRSEHHTRRPHRDARIARRAAALKGKMN